MGHEKQEETTLYIHVPIQMQKEALEQIYLTGGESWQYNFPVCLEKGEPAGNQDHGG